jgi:hypothetical protein
VFNANFSNISAISWHSRECQHRGIMLDNCIMLLKASNRYEQNADEYGLQQTFLKHVDSVAFIIHLLLS